MKLDKIQTEIVHSKSSNIIVAAGAGSGKTRILIERIKYLLETGVRPDNIVAITFTNNAAEEMRRRLINIDGIGDAFIGTIHSFANKIFSNSGCNYEILNSDKELELMRELITRYAKFTTFDHYLHYLDIQHQIEYGLIDESRMEEEFTPGIRYEIGVLTGQKDKRDIEEDEAFEAEDYPENVFDLCRKRNILTFDQLLKETTKYFQSIKASVEYLLVDELQDIGYLEYSFLEGLNADNHFYVGDDWQSIYAFKGGDVRIFLRLMENPEWTTYYMQSNYRNGKNILNLAETVIQQANNILPKTIIAVRDFDGEVEIGSKYKLDQYLTRIKKQGDFKDWFILTRTNKDLFNLSAALETAQIPFVSFKKGGATLDSIQQQLEADAVKLLTIHTAKGLESKQVLLYGNFPIHQKSYLKNSGERKVLYVGITRAEDKVIILN